MAKKGILLINIGSPRSYEVADVKKYLGLFLMDKWIIDLPFVWRWLLVNLLILPKRSPYSAANYKKIWMSEGSPLIVHSERFRARLQQEMGPEYIVSTGMCFSEPNIEQALLSLREQGVQEILAVPMFPQYAGATTGSVTDALQTIIRRRQIQTPVKILPAFYQEPAFIQNSARIAEDFLKNRLVDHYVFSFHGLPEKQVQQHGCKLDEACTQDFKNCVDNCYRSQCHENARLLATALKLQPHQWTLSFQSRLGRARWITPSTDEVLQTLAKNAVQQVAVLCPSFVADCIETLEEIGMGAAEDFRHHGGKELHLVPCLNEDNQWVKDFAQICRRT